LEAELHALLAFAVVAASRQELARRSAFEVPRVAVAAQVVQQRVQRRGFRF
jgi:hypothetical protein